MLSRLKQLDLWIWDTIFTIIAHKWTKMWKQSFPLYSGSAKHIWEYLFTDRKLNVYNVANGQSLVFLKEHHL